MPRPDVFPSAPSGGFPRRRSSAPDTAYDPSSLPTTPTTEIATSGTKGFFGDASSAAPPRRGSDTARDDGEDVHDHKVIPLGGAGEGAMRAAAAGAAGAGDTVGGEPVRRVDARLPWSSERGHRGGIAGMESDAKGGNTGVVAGLKENTESFLGLRKKE